MIQRQHLGGVIYNECLSHHIITHQNIGGDLGLACPKHNFESCNLKRFTHTVAKLFCMNER